MAMFRTKNTLKTHHFVKEIARSQGLRLSAPFTIPCSGLVLTLFRTEASQIAYQRGRKAIPCPAAHPHIGQIREYPLRVRTL